MLLVVLEIEEPASGSMITHDFHKLKILIFINYPTVEVELVDVSPALLEVIRRIEGDNVG